MKLVEYENSGLNAHHPPSKLYVIILLCLLLSTGFSSIREASRMKNFLFTTGPLYFIVFYLKGPGSCFQLSHT